MAGIHYLCSRCESRVEARRDDATICECGTEVPVVFPEPDTPVAQCGICGERELYIQKDFNRSTGIALVVVGAIFVPWTWGLSLLAVTILDYALYRYLGDVTVCYACRTVHRGFPLNPEHRPFDLLTHDRHVYGAAPPGAEEGHERA
ncbi:MAG TPA: hypothetical protein VM557_09670 [Thermoanaerobaculia bacterium]|nr:hypothetical protein [Thermoanaerobaculia bacterium]